MFRKIFAATVLCLIVAHDVSGAMKKSWKTAANFDSGIPTFTPFHPGADFMKNDESSLNEIQVKTTLSPLSPPPTAETLISKISSKIKAPSKHVPDIYKQHHQELRKNPNKDFGAFDKSSMEENEIVIEDDHIDIEQIIGQLNDEADKHQIASDNIVEIDELEISSITDDDTNATQYKVGSLMNVTIDSEDSLVNVNLDKNTLKEIFTGSRSQAISSILNSRRKVIKLLFRLSPLSQVAARRTDF